MPDNKFQFSLVEAQRLTKQEFQHYARDGLIAGIPPCFIEVELHQQPALRSPQLRLF